jgi:hypothetical protein
MTPARMIPGPEPTWQDLLKCGTITRGVLASMTALLGSSGLSYMDRRCIPQVDGTQTRTS